MNRGKSIPPEQLNKINGLLWFIVSVHLGENQKTVLADIGGTTLLFKTKDDATAYILEQYPMDVFLYQIVQEGHN